MLRASVSCQPALEANYASAYLGSALEPVGSLVRAVSPNEVIAPARAYSRPQLDQ